MKKIKRILGLVLALIMVFQMCPMYAFASDVDDTAKNVNKVLSYADQLRNANQKDDLSTGGLTWDTENKKDSWRYFNGAMLDAFIMVGTDEMLAYAVEFYKDNTNSDGSAKNYHAGEVDSVPMALGMFELLDNKTYGKRFANAIEYVYQQLKQQTVLGAEYGNNYWHKTNSSSWTTWKFGLDGLYMACVFEMEYANAVEEGKLSSSAKPADIYKSIYNRLEWVSNTMRDQKTGLYHHGWNGSQGNGHFWSRSVGWYAVALVDIIDLMPEGSYKQGLIDNLAPLFDGMLNYQDANTGMWYNVINRDASLASNKLESSGTAMMAYALMKAYNNGWVDESYGQAGLKAFNGVVANKLTGSQGSYSLIDTYKSSGVSTTDEDYTKNPYTTNEAKGVAPLIMAATVANATAEKLNAKPELVVSGTDTYFVGSKLDLTVIEKVGSKTTDVTAQASITGFDMNTAGDYTVHITYGDLHAEMSITVREKTFCDAATGITAEVSIPGATGLTVSTLDTDSKAFQAVASMVTKAAAYSIQLVNGTEATVTMPIPAGVVDLVVYRVSEDGKTVSTVDVVRNGDTVSFKAGQFSCYVIGQDDRAPEANDVVVGNGGYSYVKVNAASSLQEGYYQLQNNHTSKYLTSTKTSNANRLNLDSNGQNHIWYIKPVSGGYTIQYGGPTGQYLTFSHEKAAMSNTAQTVKLQNTNGYWGIGATSGNPAAYLAREGTSNTSGSVHGYASNDYKYPGDVGMDWNLYQRVENRKTYSVSASNIHHYLGQNDNQVQLNYSLLVNGAAGNLPAGGSWNFSTYKDIDGIVKNISSNGVITFNKVEGSCYIKVAYTWSEGTAYMYVKVISERDPNACEHKYTAVTVEATCTKDGSVTYTCTNCDDSYVEVIKAPGHDHKAKVTAPTCTEGGYTTYTCACGDTYVADEVVAKGHDYEAVVTAPTCETAGYTTYTCACGDTYVADEVAAKGHDYKAVVTAPTCETAGYTTYTCACGDTYVADETAALGHDYKAVVTAPTCETDGCTTHTCGNCGDVFVDSIIAAYGHDNTIETMAPTCIRPGTITTTCMNCGQTTVEKTPALGHSHKAVVTAPTCTEGGYTTYTCGCGDTYVADEVAALGHSYTEEVSEPTCEAEGSIKYTCHCGDTYEETLAALGHNHEAVVTAPTCTEGGYTTYTCGCGDTYVADEVAALGHDYKAVMTAPTCETAGYTTYTCECGDTYVADEVAALGHAYEAVVTAPTCEDAGYTTYTCACGETYVADEVAALGHTHEAVVIAPTCQESGYTTYTCACGDTYVADEVAATGHVYEAVVTDPTCLEGGYTTYTCDCGDTYVGDETAAHGHNYTSDDSNGYLVHTCEFCGDAYTENGAWIAVSFARLSGEGIQNYEDHEGATAETVLNKLSVELSNDGVNVSGTLDVTADMVTWDKTFNGDVVGTYTAKVVYNGIYLGTIVVNVGSEHVLETVTVAPTCEEQGYTETKCADCDYTVKTGVTEALGHSYTSEEKDGYIVYTCHCGDTYSEKTGPSYTNVTTVSNDNDYVVTVTSNGVTYALTHGNNTVSAVQVQVSNGQITSEITEDMVWSYSGNKLSYVSSGTTYYLYSYNSGNWWWTSPALGISADQSSDATFSNQQLKLGSYYLNFSNNAFVANSSGSTLNVFLES